MAAIYYDCHAFCANELVCIPMRFIYPAANPAFLQLIEGKFRGERIRHFSPERELINEGSRLKSEIAPVSGVGCVISRHDRKWRERERVPWITVIRRHPRDDICGRMDELFPCWPVKQEIDRTERGRGSAKYEIRFVYGLSSL